MPKPFSVVGRALERVEELAAEVRQFDAILRTFRSGDAGFHGREVEFHDLRVFDVTALRHAPEALRRDSNFRQLAMPSLRPVARR